MKLKTNSARIIALIAALCAGCVAVRRPQPRQPPPRIESKVIAPAISVTRPWKGIVAGRSTRAQVDHRFKPIAVKGAIVSYEIDHIEAIVSYAPGGTAASIDLPAYAAISESKLTTDYGNPDRTRAARPSGRELDYDAAGLTIVVAGEPALTRRVRLRAARGLTRPKSEELFDELVPIRPPLPDLRIRRAEVAKALGEIPPETTGEKEGAEEVYAAVSDQGLLIKQPGLQRYIRGLAARLASVTPRGASEWDVEVIKGSVPQGMNLGGGYILVTQGVIDQLGSEGQLAYILAHEMAHQLKGDLAAEQSRQVTASIIVLAGALAAGIFGGEAAARGAAQLGSVAAQAGLAPFSRDQEAGADLTALYILEAAGYDPRQALPVMDRLKSLRDKYGTPISILSTHPSPEARMAQIQEWLAARKDVDYSHALVTTQEFIELQGHGSAQ